MVIPYRNKFIKAFGASLLLFILGGVLSTGALNFSSNRELFSVSWRAGLLLIFLGYICYFWAHYLLARAKGYSGWLILLGFINTFGILVLLLLPDRRKIK